MVPDRRLTLVEPRTQFKLTGLLKRIACQTAFLTQQMCHVYNILILLFNIKYLGPK
jgi:hypothetical protein